MHTDTRTADQIDADERLVEALTGGFPEGWTAVGSSATPLSLL